MTPRPASAAGGKPAAAEVYTPADRLEQPTLAQMTEAALTVLAARPDQPFALFVEAGDVDFALHANNLDNAVGAVYSGEEAVRAVIRWVEAHSNWDESLLLVSSDHGHYLVVDDPQALAGSAKAATGEAHAEAGQEFALRVSGPAGKPIPRAEFGIERGRQPAAKIVRDRGLTVTGKVTDEAGKPIAGALVRTKFLNDIREARTGRDGVYRLAGCEPRVARIVVSAKGRAIDMKELRIEPEMGPVDFAMKPGGIIRIRVLDQQGKPVPKAHIFFQNWRGRFSHFEFDHVGQYADQNGVWVWNEAPLDEFQADICPSGDGMELPKQTMIARQEEYVFRLPATLVISGKVIDAETKQPIKAIRVVPGIRSSPTFMNWVPSQTFAASNGHYEIRPTHGFSAHLVRIEADGYLPAVSRDIKSNEGNVTIDFGLKRGKNIIAKVVTPRNLPAAGAKVALGVAGSQIMVKNGDIDDGSTYCTRLETDDAGRFHFPPQTRAFQLVILHSSGYAHIKSPAEWDLARIIHLEPWARVEGTFRIGKMPTANVPLTIGVEGLYSNGDDVPHIFTQHEVTTGPDGRFVFDRVVSGRGRIGRRLRMPVKDGAVEVASSCLIVADFPGGKTVHIDLGGAGRAVVGKLQPPEGVHEKIRWNLALVVAATEGAEVQGEGVYGTATVDRDGRFRIDDLPAGDYGLSATLDREGGAELRLSNHRFTVPPAKEGVPAQPMDLGTLTLQKR